MTDFTDEEATTILALPPPVDELTLIKHKQMQVSYGDGIKLELAYQHDNKYMREHGGDGAWYVTSPACKHKAHVETTVSSKKCEL